MELRSSLIDVFFLSVVFSLVEYFANDMASLYQIKSLDVCSVIFHDYAVVVALDFCLF